MATIPSLALLPSGYKASKVYSVLPTDGTGDFDFTRSGNATRVNSEGLIELVSTNVPRLNYPLIDGVVQGCPSLLLEPQRINLVTYSEDFSNGSWTKSQSSAILSNITSPKGTQNVYKFTENTASSKHQLFTTISSYTELTISFFAKKEERSFIAVEKSGWGNTIFDLNIGSVVSGTGDVIDFGNGWFRCSAFYTASPAQTQFYLILMQDSSTNSYQGDGNSGLYLWGIQAEAGSYATSYIPTQGSAVSRSLSNMFSDDLNNLGLINDTEGVFYTEIKMPISSTRDLSAGGLVFGNTSVWAGTRAFEISKDADGSFRIAKRDSGFIALADIVAGVYYKIAFKWDSLNVYLYVNGSLVTTSTYTQTDFKYIITDNRDSQKFIKEIKLYNTALTNAELIALTTI
jgi:hypothetical protein